MSLLTTDPAPVITFFPILIGAINNESDPINVSSPIIVSCLFCPSKLQVIVPAPIFTFWPIFESPK